MHIYSHHKNKILHVDADSFFASCERAQNHLYEKKPVCVVAGSRGIILAATYDAKKLGIKTAMARFEAEKLLPPHKAFYIPSNFSLYARFSSRMFDYFRCVTPQVEERSVDEGFLDIGGMRRVYRTSYKGIAEMIQRDVKQQLGLPVSVGIAPTKTLAKIASKKAKPFGVCEVPKLAIHTFLEQCTLEDVPGLGPNSVALLRKFNIHTVLDFVACKQESIRRLLHKPGVILHQELQGKPAMVVETENPLPKSVSRIRSFSPTAHVGMMRMELVHHLFICCSKLRRKGLRARKVFVYIRDNNFKTHGFEYEDIQAHSSSMRFATGALDRFTTMVTGKTARAVGLVFTHLEKDNTTQLSFFEENSFINKQETLFQAVDKLNNKHGRYMVRPALLQGDNYRKARKTEPFLDLINLGTVT